MSIIVLFVALFVLLIFEGLSWGNFKTLKGYRTEESPDVDGELKEPCWKQAEQAKDFSVLLVADRPAEEQTIGRVVYDDDNVYLGIECLEPRMDLVRQAVEKNTDTFEYAQGQMIEIFIGVRGDRRNFLQLMVNTNGTWNLHTTDPMQLKNFQIQTAVHLGEDRFTMEIKIPFSALHLLPNSEGMWDFNLCRSRMTEGNHLRTDPNIIFSVWQNLGGPFRQPDKFGRLAMPIEPTDYFYEVEADEINGSLQLKVKNRTGKDRDVLLEVQLADRDRPEVHSLTLKADQEADFEYPIQEGGIDLQLAIKDARTGKIFYRGGTAFKEVDDPLLDENSFTPANISDEPYTVFVKDYMERGNHKTQPRDGQIGQPIQMFASLGEYQPASFAVRANRNLEQVKASLTGDLKGPNGATISKDRVEIRTVELMKRWNNPYEFIKTECFLTRNRPRDISIDNTQRYWLTLHVPQDAVPGDYETKIKVSPADENAKEIALKVQILPIRLEKPEGMNFFIYFGLGYPINLPEKLLTEKYVRMIYDDMREHGMTTVTVYASPAGEGWIDIHRDGEGLPMAVQMDLIRDAGLVADWSAVPWIRAELFGHDVWKMVMDETTKRNWPELLFYLVDEPTAGRYEQIESCMERLASFKKKYPQYSSIRTTTAGAEDPVVARHYDVWIAGSSAPRTSLERGRQMGKAIWTYDCGLGPVDAINARHYYGLWCWKSGVKGASLWAYIDLPSMQNRFAMDGGWRDSQLDLTEYKNLYSFVYPSSEGIIPTIGWEATREGVDDYRYLWTLKKTIGRVREANLSTDLIDRAEATIKEVEDSFDIDSQARIRDETTDRVGVLRREFERKPPEPELADGGYDRLRYKVAQEIIKLDAALEAGGST